MTGTRNRTTAENHEEYEADHRDGDVRQLLTKQELELGDRRRTEVGDGAGFFLAHDRDRRHDGWNQNQHQHDHARHHRIDALERLVVAKARLEIDGARRSAAWGALRDQVLHVSQGKHCDITLRRLGTKRHAAIEPHPDLRRAAALEVAAEAGRDLDGDLKLAAAKPELELIGGSDRRLFHEVPRNRRERVDQRSALERSILIESGEAQMLDIE